MKGFLFLMDSELISHVYFEADAQRINTHDYMSRHPVSSPLIRSEGVDKLKLHYEQHETLCVSVWKVSDTHVSPSVSCLQLNNLYKCMGLDQLQQGNTRNMPCWIIFGKLLFMLCWMMQ